MLEYDQSEFFLDVPEAISMDSIGYVYVPTACKNKTRGETFSFNGVKLKCAGLYWTVFFTYSM